MAIVAVSIAPVGEGVSVSDYVADAIKVLDNHEEVDYELGPMFTTIEGDPDVVFDVVRKMQEVMFEKGAQRVSTVLKMDDRRDREHKMQKKMNSIQSKLE